MRHYHYEESVWVRDLHGGRGCRDLPRDVQDKEKQLAIQKKDGFEAGPAAGSQHAIDKEMERLITSLSR